MYCGQLLTPFTFFSSLESEKSLYLFVLISSKITNRSNRLFTYITVVSSPADLTGAGGWPVSGAVAVFAAR